ncbi:LacI family DNA-binding transcriptional regulator [Lachnospiraceae bacterium 38-10]
MARATIKDVAARSGFSTSTVSRALSGKIFVEEETKRKILEAVEELHYRPSMIAKSLKDKKTMTIAVMVPDLNSLFYSTLVDSVEKYASEEGYTVILCNGHGSVKTEKRSMEMLQNRFVDGIICLSVTDEITHIWKASKQSGIPVVFINREFQNDMSCIVNDGEYGCHLITKYLLEKGHRRIYGIFGSQDTQISIRRKIGFQKAMEEFGVWEERLALMDASRVQTAYEYAKKILGGDERPTAIVISEEAMVIGVYRAAAECGLRVPEDLSLIGFDNVYTAEYMQPPLTTCDAQISELAEKSVKCLLRQISGEDIGRERIYLRSGIEERASVRAL